MVLKLWRNRLLQQAVAYQVANADIQPISQAMFEQALPELWPEIHRYCSRMTGSVIDGEDVLQSACLKAFEALKRGDEVINLRAWLFRVAHNVTLDFLRSKKRERAVLNATLPAAEAAPKTIQRSDVADSLRRFLVLPPRQRSTVIFRDIFGYTADEVANLTDSSVASVKASLHRGRANLKRDVTTPAAETSPLTPEERQRLGPLCPTFQRS